MLKVKTMIAIALIAVGIAGFTYQGVTFMTSARTPSTRSASAGPTERHRIPLPPVIGLAALILGFALLLKDNGDFRQRPPRRHAHRAPRAKPHG